MKITKVTPISINIFTVTMSLPIPFRMGEVSKPSILFITSLYDSKYLVNKNTAVHTSSFLGSHMSYSHLELNQSRSFPAASSGIATTRSAPNPSNSASPVPARNCCTISPVMAVSPSDNTKPRATAPRPIITPLFL